MSVRRLMVPPGGFSIRCRCRHREADGTPLSGPPPIGSFCALPNPLLCSWSSGLVGIPGVACPSSCYSYQARAEPKHPGKDGW